LYGRASRMQCKLHCSTSGVGCRPIFSLPGTAFMVWADELTFSLCSTGGAAEGLYGSLTRLPTPSDSLSEQISLVKIETETTYLALPTTSPPDYLLPFPTLHNTPTARSKAATSGYSRCALQACEAQTAFLDRRPD
jgi:hypothetical protein